ncbi:MAG: hypothetical protein ABJA02_11870 [Acidobacteriota bacterium]
MKAGSGFEIIGESDQAGAFEVDYSSDGIMVWLWSGAVASIFSDGEELGAQSASKQLAVPSLVPSAN